MHQQDSQSISRLLFTIVALFFVALAASNSSAQENSQPESILILEQSTETAESSDIATGTKVETELAGAEKVESEVETVELAEAPGVAHREATAETEEAIAADAHGITHYTESTFRIFGSEELAWIKKLIFLFLTICVLGWLLSLMTNQSNPQTEAVPESAAGSRLQATTGDASDLGPVFRERPAHVDDLTKIGGIDAEDEKRLNEAGIWNYAQLQRMTAAQRANLQRKLNLPRLRWYSIAGLCDTSTATMATDAKNDLSEDASPGHVGDQQAAAGQNDATLSAAAIVAPESKSVVARDENGSILRIDSAGKVDVPAPKFSDDLTTLPGVNRELAAAMNATGIYSVEQLKTLDAQQQAAFENRFGLAYDKLDLTAGQGSQGEISRTATAVRPGSTAGSTGTTSFAQGGGNAVVDPGHGDERGENREGQGGKEEESASMETVPGAGRPVEESGIAASSGSDIATSSSSGSSANPGAQKVSDDLTRLIGIDADAAAKLSADGIHSFDQLKDLDERQFAALVEKHGLSSDADLSDWRRCIYAWGRGIHTTAEGDASFEAGLLHRVELPQIAPGVFDGEKLVAYPEQVIFRGSNPEGWGRGQVDSMEGVETSLRVDAIRNDINFLRIRRTDTRESVVVPMTKGQIFANGDSSENGWNGSSEVFFGGRHIGVFAQHLPQEIETKFGQGGWGFGHRYDHNDRQEWGWAGRVIEPTTFEISVGCIGQAAGTVVFRSSDPSIWNTRTRDSDQHFSDPVSIVSHPVNFVRIVREATGEAAIIRVDGNHVLDEGFDPRCGWNGSAKEFSGGRHLGVYHCDLPQDFETRFEFGGWGFGHPYDDNDRQAWGWAGRQLPETVFEISLLESVPEFMQHEIIE